MELRLWLWLLVVLQLFGNYVTFLYPTQKKRNEPKPAVKSKPYPLNKRFTDMIDFALETVRDVVRENHYYSANLPNIDTKVGGISFASSSGTAWNMATLARNGDVTATNRSSDVIDVTAAVTVKTLEIGYQSYSVDVPAVGKFSGSLKINIGENRLRFWVTVRMKEGGKGTNIELTDAKVEKLVFDKTDITGFGAVLNWLANLIINSVLNGSTGVISRILEDKAKVEINKILKNQML